MVSNDHVTAVAVILWVLQTVLHMRIKFVIVDCELGYRLRVIEELSKQRSLTAT